MKNISGFTIVELLMTIAIASVLIVIGVPSMQEFIKNNRLITVHNELVSAMQVARSSAIQRSGTACVCSSSTAGTGAPSCDGGDNWESGWIAFVDTNATALATCIYEPGVGDILLKAWDGTPYGAAISVRTSDANINNNDFVSFNPRGAPVTFTGLSLQGMYKVCDDRGLTDGTRVYGKGIVLSASGSLRSTSDTTQIIACL